MCRVPVQLRELVKQRLSAAAEEIFELLEKTITEYEEHTERQRSLLEQLLQPRVRLSASDQGGVRVEEEECPCEPPHIKEELDFTKTQLCSSPKKTDDLTVPTWNTHQSPPQPDVSAVPKSEERSSVSVKTEEGPLDHTHTVPLSPPGGSLHTQTIPLPPPGGALHTHTVPVLPLGGALHTQTVPLPPLGGALHTQTVPLPPLGGALHTQTVPLHPLGGALHTQTEEESVPQNTWTEPSLALHQPMDSPEPPQSQPCPGPSAAVTSLYPPGGALYQAQKSQKPQKRFHCTLCPKAFASNFHLVSHMRVHTGERPFRCPVCEKSFRVKGNLDQHMMIHYDLRPFICTFCGKAFSQKSNLNNHLWVHTGVKPFSCSICGKQYRQRSSLSLHMASH